MARRLHKSMLLVVILVGGIAAGPASAREPSVAERLDTLPALPRQAILRFARTDLEEWRYVRTRESEEGVLVDRHDPSLPGAEHWQLVSIDGREPTDEERRDYEKDRADHSRDEDTAQAERIAAMIVPDSLRPLGTEGGDLRYFYRMRSPDGEHRRVFRAMEGELLVVDDTESPWVRTVRVWNHETFRPVIGVRIDEARLRFDFAIHDGWVLPVAAEANWTGAILMLKDVDRRLRFTLGDFQRVAGSQIGEVAALP